MSNPNIEVPAAASLEDLLGKVDNLHDPVPILNRRPVAYGLVLFLLVSVRCVMILSSTLLWMTLLRVHQRWYLLSAPASAFMSDFVSQDAQAGTIYSLACHWLGTDPPWPSCKVADCVLILVVVCRHPSIRSYFCGLQLPFWRTLPHLRLRPH